MFKGKSYCGFSRQGILVIERKAQNRNNPLRKPIEKDEGMIS